MKIINFKNFDLSKIKNPDKYELKNGYVFVDKKSTILGYCLLKENNNISFEKITDYWKDTGTPEDIIHANEEILKKQFDDEGLDQNWNLGEGTKLESKVIIKGPVIFGKNCHIFSGEIGPNVSVGDNTTISGSSIENSIIMENCKINSTAKIKNSIIANNSEIKDENGIEKIFLLGEGSKVSL